MLVTEITRFAWYFQIYNAHRARHFTQLLWPVLLNLLIRKETQHLWHEHVRGAHCDTTRPDINNPKIPEMLIYPHLLHAFLKRVSVRAVYERCLCIQRSHISRGASPLISSCASALTFPRSSAGFRLGFIRQISWCWKCFMKTTGNNMTQGWTNLHFRIREREAYEWMERRRGERGKKTHSGYHRNTFWVHSHSDERYKASPHPLFFPSAPVK